MSNRSSLLPCLRLLCIAAAGFFATGQAAMAEPQEIKVVEHADTDAVTDTGDKGDTAGDILTFANEVYDADDKNKVGSDQGICFRTLVGKAWECFWTISLDKGQITVEGPFLDAGDSVLAITGGTGDFAGATGDMALKARGTDGKAYDFIYKSSSRHTRKTYRVKRPSDPIRCCVSATAASESGGRRQINGTSAGT